MVSPSLQYLCFWVLATALQGENSAEFPQRPGDWSRPDLSSLWMSHCSQV